MKKKKTPGITPAEAARLRQAARDRQARVKSAAEEKRRREIEAGLPERVHFWRGVADGKIREAAAEGRSSTDIGLPCSDLDWEAILQVGRDLRSEGFTVNHETVHYADDDPGTEIVVVSW
jgi:hypothetical protein